jgi:hypothetical protein
MFKNYLDRYQTKLWRIWMLLLISSCSPDLYMSNNKPPILLEEKVDAMVAAALALNGLEGAVAVMPINHWAVAFSGYWMRKNHEVSLSTGPVFTLNSKKTIHLRPMFGGSLGYSKSKEYSIFPPKIYRNEVAYQQIFIQPELSFKLDEHILFVFNPKLSTVYFSDFILDHEFENQGNINVGFLEPTVSTIISFEPIQFILQFGFNRPIDTQYLESPYLYTPFNLSIRLRYNFSLFSTSRK